MRPAPERGVRNRFPALVLVTLLATAPAAPAWAGGTRVTRERPKIAETAKSVEQTLGVPAVGKSAISAGIDKVGEAVGIEFQDRNVLEGEGKAEGGFKTRVEAANGGFLEVELVRGEIAAKGSAGTVKNGVQASAAANVEGTIAAVKGDTGRVVAGDPELIHVDGKAAGEAEVRGKAQAAAQAKATTHAIEASASGSAFVGARAAGKVDGKATLCGVSIVGKGDGELSVGAGATASATFAIDWTNLKFRVGANAAAAVGVGGGLGGDVEISLEKLKKDPAKAGECAIDAVEKVAGADAARAVEATAKEVIATGEKVAAEAKVVVENVAAETKVVAENVTASASVAVENVASSAAVAVENVRGAVQLALPGLGGSNAARDAETTPAGTTRGGIVAPAGGASAAGVAR